MATHSSILAWGVLWIEEPDRLPVTTLLPSYRKTQWSSQGLTLGWLNGLCSQGMGRSRDWLLWWLTSGSHVFSGWAASSP